MTFFAHAGIIRYQDFSTKPQDHRHINNIDLLEPVVPFAPSFDEILDAAIVHDLDYQGIRELRERIQHEGRIGMAETL